MDGLKKSLMVDSTTTDVQLGDKMSDMNDTDVEEKVDAEKTVEEKSGDVSSSPETVDENQGNSMPSPEEEEAALRIKYGGMLPRNWRKPTTRSRIDHNQTISVGRANHKASGKFTMRDNNINQVKRQERNSFNKQCDINKKMIKSQMKKPVSKHSLWMQQARVQKAPETPCP